MPPDELVLFLDRSLGRRTVAEALRSHGIKVEIHDNHFPPNTADVDWLKAAGRSRWSVVTHDKNIRHRRLEQLAVRDARVGVFVLTARTISGDQMATVLVKNLDAIRRIVNDEAAPFIALVSRDGVKLRRPW